MNLFIMTRGRVGKQYTLSRLPQRWKEKTWLVVPMDERGKHEYTRVLAAPREVTNYSQKFQWILDGFKWGTYADPIPGYEQLHTYPVFGDDEKAVILDDDLVFSNRVLIDGKPSLRTIDDAERTGVLFDYIEELLSDTALVGVHPRQMGQNTKPPYVDNGRIICIQGINRRFIGKVKVDQFPILADVVLNCTLLSRGQANKIITTHFQDHGPCQAPGGCSIYRTSEMQRAAVEYLAQRWPDYVKVVERRVKTNWLQNEDGVRYDYTCQWKRLYAAGSAYVLGGRTGINPDKEGGRP